MRLEGRQIKLNLRRRPVPAVRIIYKQITEIMIVKPKARAGISIYANS